MKKFFVILTLLALSGCASTPEEPPTASELYTEATREAARANFIGAEEKFEELISTFPTSVYAQQAILDQIHLYHKRREYDLAIDTADQFISLYPDHEKVDYAMYMKGIIYFRGNRGILDHIGQQDSTSRSQELKRLSFDAFRELITQYPDSKYAPDSTERMKYLINALARNEIHTANYYLKQNAYLAVIGRAKEVLSSYPDSDSLEEALLLLEIAYRNLGANDAADDAKRLLELNFKKYNNL